MADYIRLLRNMVGHEKVIMVACGALIFNEEGSILLHHRADNGYWGHPGGFMELGETVQETARREAWEETGLRLHTLDLFGIYSGSDREVVLPNGDQVAFVKIIFTCHDYSGELVCHDGESLHIKFFPLNQLPGNLFPAQYHVFEDLFSGKQPPFIA